MTVLSTTNIGPVAMQPYNFLPQFNSTANVRGFRTGAFTGDVALAPAYALSELVANPAAYVTVGGATGVLEYVSSDNAMLTHFNGYYLLQSFDFTPSRIGDDARFTGFALHAILLGDVA